MMIKTLDAVDLAPVICRYAEQFHRVGGDTHHVASPLGAWMLLALCAPAANGRLRDELSAILGLEADTAASRAARLLDNPHKAVASAVAFWTQTGLNSGRLATFLAQLPVPVERSGRIPEPQELDLWARKHTFGLIDRFPVQPNPLTTMLLASALATKVSWLQPFKVAPAAELGVRSEWSRRLTRVLRANSGDEHLEFIARSERAGDVAVHAARARNGLMVTSVIAHPDAPASDVLAAAYEIATKIATRSRAKVSLFELPLGDGPLWSIAEREVAALDAAGVERYTAVLPAWEAHSNHDLCGAGLGFEPAGAALMELALQPLVGMEAKQAAMARYTRLGFEAAAVTAMSLTRSGFVPPRQRAIERHATLRFGHPFAVVAVATGHRWDYELRTPAPEAWNGLPVFSAWVAEPMEAEDHPDGEFDDDDVEWVDDDAIESMIVTRPKRLPPRNRTPHQEFRQGLSELVADFLASMRDAIRALVRSFTG